MHLVDKDGSLSNFLTDPARKVPKSHLKIVCKSGAGSEQCRYIARTPQGCWCVKNTPIKGTLDHIVVNSNGGARGDNCPGFGVMGENSVVEKTPVSPNE